MPSAVHVGEARRRVVEARAGSSVGEAARTEVQVARARGRHQADRTPARAAVEEPHVASSVRRDHVRRARAARCGTRACHTSGGSYTCASASRIG